MYRHSLFFPLTYLFSSPSICVPNRQFVAYIFKQRSTVTCHLTPITLKNEQIPTRNLKNFNDRLHHKIVIEQNTFYEKFIICNKCTRQVVTSLSTSLTDFEREEKTDIPSQQFSQFSSQKPTARCIP